VTFDLVRITDTSGKSTGNIGDIRYQALTEDELDNLYCWESDASYIGWDFKVERLGEVYVPSLDKEE
jgi:hypothetical protein